MNNPVAFKEENATLWHKDFIILLVVNALFHASVFLQFSVLGHCMSGGMPYGGNSIGVTLLAFIVGMFLPGALNSYLVDRFRRRNVLLYSILLYALLSLAWLHVTENTGLFILRSLQGGAFATALMASGATLAIDTTPSVKRNIANRVFTCFGVIGMLAGFTVGYWGGISFSFAQWVYVSSALCFVLIPAVLMINVCFRAPLGLPLFSLDRFILPKTLLPGVNMMAVAVTSGIVFVAVSDASFYIFAGVGFLCYLFFSRLPVFSRVSRLAVVIGQLLAGTGIMMLFCGEGKIFLYGSAVLIGFGTAASLACMLQMMILLSSHCERGTGYHTYQLLWESGLILGIGCVWCEYLSDLSFAYQLALGICGAGLFLYVLFTHSYFTRKYTS